MRFSPQSVLVFGALVLLPACVTKTVPVQSSPTAQAAQPGFAPTMTIERFLRAVNQKDIDTMARLFGTAEGPVSATWTRREVDDRMLIFASVLRHTDYQIGAESVVPGRRGEATTYSVNLVTNEKRSAVPFSLVKSRKDGEWLIENINIECLTRSC